MLTIPKNYVLNIFYLHKMAINTLISVIKFDIDITPNKIISRQKIYLMEK